MWSIPAFISPRRLTRLESPSPGRRQCTTPAARLARENRRLPLPCDDDRTADRAQVRQFLLQAWREHARGHEFEYAEQFEFMGPPEDPAGPVAEYIATKAIRTG